MPWAWRSLRVAKVTRQICQTVSTKLFFEHGKTKLSCNRAVATCFFGDICFPTFCGLHSCSISLCFLWVCFSKTMFLQNYETKVVPYKMFILHLLMCDVQYFKTCMPTYIHIYIGWWWAQASFVAKQTVHICFAAAACCRRECSFIATGFCLRVSFVGKAGMYMQSRTASHDAHVMLRNQTSESFRNYTSKRLRNYTSKRLRN